MNKQTALKTEKASVDSLIASLVPAGRVELSRSNGFVIVAERSGDGRDLRIVRESANGFAVIRQERF